MALRTVPWLTRKRAARSISLGIASPGFHSPACRLCRIRPLICWYSGLKAGVAGAAASGGGRRSAVEGEWAAHGVRQGWQLPGALNHILYKT